MERVYSYDFEFLERGPGYPVQPISVGVESWNGRLYYAVFDDFDFEAARTHDFLKGAVIPHLPTRYSAFRGLALDRRHIDVKSRVKIRAELEKFFLLDELVAADETAELWGYYSDYDHVCLAQVWGTMVKMPKGLPWYTLDMKQEMLRRGVSREDLPIQEGTEHHALDDARGQMAMLKWLDQHDAGELDLPVLPAAEDLTDPLAAPDDRAVWRSRLPLLTIGPCALGCGGRSVCRLWCIDRIIRKALALCARLIYRMMGCPSIGKLFRGSLGI